MYMVITFKQMVQLMLIHGAIRLIVMALLAIPKVLDLIRVNKKKRDIERSKAEEELAKAELELNDLVESQNKKRIIGFRSDTITNADNMEERS